MDTLNRSAIAVKPKQPFLDWLHAADPTSHEITSPDVCREPTIYLIPECDTDEELADVLRELCVEIFEEQLAGWYRDTSTGHGTGVTISSASGSTTGITPCWLIFVMNL